MKKPDFLSFTLQHVRDYGGKIQRMGFYEFVDVIHKGGWSYLDSERWNFAVDYTGKGRITNIGIVSKRNRLGTGLLYDNRGFVKLVSLLDHHKWGMA